MTTTPQEARDLAKCLQGPTITERVKHCLSAAALLTEYAALLEQQAQPVAEVHAAHLRPSDDGGHWCREVLLYSGNNPGDQSANGGRVKLYAAQPQPAPLTDDEIHELFPETEFIEDGHDQWGYKCLREVVSKDALQEFARAVERRVRGKA